jgi:hypothetical protein
VLKEGIYIILGSIFICAHKQCAFRSIFDYTVGQYNN